MEFRFILDPSALVYGGIGKIRKWCVPCPRGQATAVLYVPYYTLNELDFLKKVYNPLISSNARDSIRFIDEQVTAGAGGTAAEDLPSFSDEEDSAHGSDDYESYHRAIKAAGPHAEGLKNRATFQLEGENDMGFSWQAALKYRCWIPHAEDFPSYDESKQGVYGMKMAGGFRAGRTQEVRDLFAELERDESASESDGDGDSDQVAELATAEKVPAKVPRNLKSLISYAVQKHYVENKGPWFVVSEEVITDMWLRSFGLHVINLTTAEKLLNGTLTLQQVLASEEGDMDQSVVSVREFYNPKTHKLDYLGKSKTSLDAPGSSVIALDEHPMLFDPVSGELVRVDKFKGLRSTFQRSRGSANRGRGGRGGGRGSGRPRAKGKGSRKENE